MELSNSVTSQQIRKAIDQFLRERLSVKLEPFEKAAANDSLSEERRQAEQEKADKLREQFQREIWLASAAKRASQIKLVTHPVKMTHPDAKGTSVFAVVNETPYSLLSTSTLGAGRAEDVVGNAAALDIYAFLSKTEVEGQKLLSFALRREPAFIAALSNNNALAEEWATAFAALSELDEEVASHPLAKQLYWPLDGGGYQLLAPLASSSLSHAVKSRIDSDRFSDEAKEARDARKKQQWHESPEREYPNLLEQKFGGTKPQNISQLNSERGGRNYLLPSRPPVWNTEQIRPPLNIETLFGAPLYYRSGVKELLKALTGFLTGLPEHINNVHIRRKRQQLVEQLVDIALLHAADLQALQPGWSAKSQLVAIEQHWLDPHRATSDEEFAAARGLSDWQKQVAARFSNWLNAHLRRAKLDVSKPEYDGWRTDLGKELSMFREGLIDVSE